MPQPTRASRARVAHDRHVEDVLEAMVQESPALLYEKYRPDCCIAATSIALDVLKYFHVDAQPLPVRATAMNRAMRERHEQGNPPTAEEIAAWQAKPGPIDPTEPWGVGLGFENGGPGWAGHLIAVIEERWLLDLALRQASRPERGLVVPDAGWGTITRPLPRRVDQAGRLLALADLADGGTLTYWTAPDAPDWRDAPDWGHTRPTKGAVTLGLIHAVEAAL